MARNAAWRRKISDVVSWRQDQGLEATMFIVREIGPTGFLLKEEGEEKPYKTYLGDPHACTCPSFRKDRELCKHLCWLLLKKFKVDRFDQLSWQLGLVERELAQVIHGEESRRLERIRPETARKDKTIPVASDGRAALEQREITEDDTCPICMENLLEKRLPVTYCKYGCGNSIHIKCMKVWADHQKTMTKKTIECPLCREDFGDSAYLKEEYRNTAVTNLHQDRIVTHPNSFCRGCSLSPITNKIYRCKSCDSFQLCQKCFGQSIHTHHQFEFRKLTTGRWRLVQRNVSNGLSIAPSVVSQLMNRDLATDDYELLLHLGSNNSASVSDMPESEIEKLPVERVRTSSRYLAPGEQCCICLRSYCVGDIIKRLPDCRHKFHKSCIDDWLLHQQPTCPIDGQAVWNGVPLDLSRPANRSGRRRGAANSRGDNSRSGQIENNENMFELTGLGITSTSGRSNGLTAAIQTPNRSLTPAQQNFLSSLNNLELSEVNLGSLLSSHNTSREPSTAHTTQPATRQTAQRTTQRTTNRNLTENNNRRRLRNIELRQKHVINKTAVHNSTLEDIDLSIGEGPALRNEVSTLSDTRKRISKPNMQTVRPARQPISVHQMSNLQIGGRATMSADHQKTKGVIKSGIRANNPSISHHRNATLELSGTRVREHGVESR